MKNTKNTSITGNPKNDEILDMFHQKMRNIRREMDEILERYLDITGLSELDFAWLGAFDPEYEDLFDEYLAEMHVKHEEIDKVYRECDLFYESIGMDPNPVGES